MTRLASLLFLILSLAAAPAPGSTADAAPQGLILHESPRAVPNFAFADETAAPHTLADHSGRYLLLSVWATWCPPCIAEMPALLSLADALPSERFRLVPIAVDKGGPAAVRRFLGRRGLDAFPVLAGAMNEVFAALGDHRLPVALLIDPEGREIGRAVGPVAWDSEETITLLRRIVAGR